MKNLQFTAGEIAQMINGKVLGDAGRIVRRVSAMRYAQSDDLSFVGNKRYRSQLETTAAGTVLVCPELEKENYPDKTLIVCENVDLAFARIAGEFAEEPPEWEKGVHPSAVVSPAARLGEKVSVGANAVIEAGAVIGDGAVIGAGCYIGHDAEIGSGTLLYPNVTVMYRCVVGKICIIHPGVVIGADGFGFVPGPKGLVKVPQTGIVRIGDDVEIGANTTIDRARFGETRIGNNVKIDDQVMVAHNVVVGDSSILVAQSGIAGSSELGRGVIIAAKAGINGHIQIGDGCQVAGTSAVLKTLAPGSVVIGTPAESQREFMARVTLPSKVEKLSAKLKALEAELAELKAGK